MNRTVVVFTSMLLACTAAPATARLNVGGDDCDVESRYSLKVEPARFVFTADDGKRTVDVLPGGRVKIDGAPLALSAADRARMGDLERGMRALVPEVKAIAIDAVGIAFEAVGHATTAFASSPRAARESAERIARTSHELQKGIADRQHWDSTTDSDFDRLVEAAVGALVGELVGNVTAMALKIAFTGDEAAVAELEARAASIEKTVEAAVEASSRQLERRADALCARLRDLDAIESLLEARLPGNERFDLIERRH